ncbi:MAG TPA: hypothetical protein PLI96_09255 [Halothiobacillus sp.]|nr:hypothetical protein [Halothiobacillus sp.]
MSWKTVTMAGIQSAMTLSDHLGLEKFRKLHGFYEAKDIHMYWHGRGPYEARPILAAAFAHLNPSAQAIQSTDFMNNDAHDFLEQHFGFNKRQI